MNTLKENIALKIREIVEKNGYLHIETVVRGNPQTPVFEIYVDNETGIDSDDCMSLSREISIVLDDDDLVPAKYRLDVSSPGVERSLKYLKQYNKHINRDFEVKYISNDEIKILNGKLTGINGEDLKFSAKDEIVINFNNIKSAKVLISF